MKIKAVITSVLLAGTLGASSIASAEGELDGAWFNTRIKTTVKKNHALVATVSPSLSVVFNNSPIQFDSGKTSCFSALHWQGAGTHQYELVQMCIVGGNWQSISQIPGIEYNDGSVAVFSSAILGEPMVLPAEGTYPPIVYFDGIVYLKTSLKSNGSLKSVKLVQPVDGSVFLMDQPSASQIIYGSSGPGLKMKWVDASQVPAGAQACLASVLGTGPAVPNCS